MKKNFLVVLAMAFTIIVVPSLLFAGGSKSAEGEKPKKETTIKVMVIAQVYANGFDMVADQVYKELGVKFEYDMSPPQDAYSKTMMEFATKTSTADIVLFMPANLADYAPHLEPIEPMMKKYNLDFKLNDIMLAYRNLYCSWDGVLYAIPWDGDQFNLFYNKIAFGDDRNKKAFKTEYGYDLAPPETWDQYLDMARFFNGRDWDFDGKKEYGTVEAWQRGGYAYWWWWSKFVPYGGIPFDENMNPLIDSPAGKKALALTVEIAKTVPPGTANFGYPECESAFVKGDAPMVIQWSSTGKTAEDPEQSERVGHVGAALLPGVDKGGKILHRFVLPTGWTIVIPKYSKNKEMAIRAVEIVSRPENALRIALNPKTAVDPWRISSFEAPDWENLWTDNPGYGKQFIEVQKKTVELAVPDLQIPGSDEYTKSADAEISAAIVGKKTVNQALADATAEWNAITERRGKAEQKKAWLIQYRAMQKAGIKYEPSLAQ